MKKILVGLSLILMSAIAFGQPTADQAYLLNNKMGPVAFRTQLGTLLLQSGELQNNTSGIYYNGADGISTFHKRVARVIYNFQYKNQQSSTVDSGVHNTGVSLPMGAVITDSYIAVTSTITTAPANSMLPRFAVGCGATGNIYSTNAIQQVTAGTVAGGPTSTALGHMQYVGGNSCAIKATVTSTGTAAEYAAGNMIIFVEYTVAQ